MTFPILLAKSGLFEGITNPWVFVPILLIVLPVCISVIDCCIRDEGYGL